LSVGRADCNFFDAFIRRKPRERQSGAHGWRRTVELHQEVRAGGAHEHRQQQPIFQRLEPKRYPVSWPKFANGSGPYVRSIEYDLQMLERYLALYVHDDSLIIILGDHQPVAEVNGHEASHGVPIHVLSRKPALLTPFLARGYVPGMRPRLVEKPPGLETFLPALLSDFSSK